MTSHKSDPARERLVIGPARRLLGCSPVRLRLQNPISPASTKAPAIIPADDVPTIKCYKKYHIFVSPNVQAE